MTAVLEAHGLVKRFTQHAGAFGTRRTTVTAVDRVALTIPVGQSLGLVGESGCGKSTVARCLLRLIEPDAGTVTFEGTDLGTLSGAALRQRRQRLQIVFQDPYGSLNPKRTVFQTLAEPLRVHGLARGAALRERTAAVMDEVGLPQDSLQRYPHEFSGGQRQRLGIARALIMDPSCVVADEPVSALDVSVQAQILRLLGRLRADRGLSFLFVSHDLGVVRHFCDAVAVMYLGRIVETGPVPAIFDRPLHPYTRLLRATSPVPDPRARTTLPRIEGELPSPLDPPRGCTFHPRCPMAVEHCRVEAPELRVIEGGRMAACHLA